KLIVVDKEILHHVGKVLRSKIGEKILINTGKNSAIYQIEAIASDSITLMFHEKFFSTELPIEIDLLCGLLKGDKHEMVVQKITEIGISTVFFCPFKRSISKWDLKTAGKKIERLTKIAKAASEQSKRTKLTKLMFNEKLESFNFADYDLILVAYEEEKNKHLSEMKTEIKSASKILYVIGPEGGITTEEITMLLNQGANIQTVSLGKRILRAETACIAAGAQLAFLIEGEEWEQ
ncbi:MAG: RsmE family RNA methyltransferase, partial [Mycoplasmatales bacterium]